MPGATRLGRGLYFIRAELLAYVEQGRMSQSGGPGKIDGKRYADFLFQHADGSVERVRKRSPVQSTAGADEFEHH